MKNYFVINPAAGGGKFLESLSEKIREACLKKGADYEIYTTKGPGDATDFVRGVCRSAEDVGEQISFYSCGGDGTNYEVISGAVGADNARVGFIPSGTGNDFIRCFEGNEKFSDIGAQLDGDSEKIDLLRCNDRYVMNMLNTGFDCEVARKAASLKRYPLISSSMAYIMGVVVELVKKPTTGFKITADGKDMGEHSPLLLATFSNGRFCGGGFKSSPLARLRSGEIDVCLIKNISRAKFVSIVGQYRSGEYLFNKKLEGLIEYFRAKSVEVDFGEERNICIDGEIFATPKFKLDILPRALNIIVPRGARFAENEDEGLTATPVGAML